MSDTDTQKAYQQARDRLQALLDEQATLEGRIRDLSAAGQHRAMAEAATRKLILPQLIEHARRELAPLDLAALEEELAEAEAAMPPLRERVEAAQAAVRQAEADLAEALQPLHVQSGIAHDLRLAVRDARRRVNAYQQPATAAD